MRCWKQHRASSHVSDPLPSVSQGLGWAWAKEPRPATSNVAKVIVASRFIIQLTTRVRIPRTLNLSSTRSQHAWRHASRNCQTSHAIGAARGTNALSSARGGIGPRPIAGTLPAIPLLLDRLTWPRASQGRDPTSVSMDWRLRIDAQIDAMLDRL